MLANENITVLNRLGFIGLGYVARGWRRGLLQLETSDFGPTHTA